MQNKLKTYLQAKKRVDLTPSEIIKIRSLVTWLESMKINIKALTNEKGSNCPVLVCREVRISNSKTYRGQQIYKDLLVKIFYLPDNLLDYLGEEGAVERLGVSSKIRRVFKFYAQGEVDFQEESDILSIRHVSLNLFEEVFTKALALGLKDTVFIFPPISYPALRILFLTLAFRIRLFNSI